MESPIEKTPRKIIVMTGATAGIGEHAVKIIAAQPNTRVIIGVRGSGRTIPEGTEMLPLDLASLASVRAFADAVEQRLEGQKINMLVLNAGAQYPKMTYSADGFEATFAVNDLAHYLVARRLLANIADGGRLVITTSETHDPAIFWLAPTTLNPQTLAHPGDQGGGMRAYPASKLCNLLTARSFAALEEVQARHIQVVAYTPGLTLGTSLGREAPVWVQFMKPLAYPLFSAASFFNSAFYPGTPKRGGEVLSQLALGQVTPPSGRIYVSLVKGEITYPDPSELARSDEASDLLWRESATMVGLPLEMRAEPPAIRHGTRPGF